MKDPRILELTERLASQGVSTVAVKDGRLLLISVDMLLDLMETALKADSDHAVLFIKDPENVN